MFRNSFKSEAGNSTFSFNNYKGNKSFTIFHENSKKPMKLALNLDFYAVCCRLFNKVKEGQAGAREYTRIKAWNPTDKKFEFKYMFALGISDTGIYYMEVSEDGRPPMIFPIKGSTNYTNGSDDFTASQKSKMTFFKIVELFNSGEIFNIPEKLEFDGNKKDNNSNYSNSNSSYNNQGSEGDEF